MEIEAKIEEIPVITEIPETNINRITDPLRIRAEEIAMSMEDRLLASQILISGIDGSGSLPPHTVELLTKYPAGGVMLFRYNLNTSKDDIRRLLSQTTELINNESGIPPFMAVDHEGGTVNRFSRGVADLPNASNYWNIFQEKGREAAHSQLEKDSLKAAEEINRLGINMNFAPVAEHLNDNNSDFLLYRSYGPDPFFTYQSSRIFMHSMEQKGVLCVIKHFPGSAGIDPHHSASVINIDKEEIYLLTFPFLALLNSGARAVMIAHTSVPSIDSTIASLSQVFMRDLLKNELGFDGIIICDDFAMAAAGTSRGGLSPYEAAVRSIAAGADMVLVWPPDLILTHNAIMSALEDGKLPRDRLQDAVQRIIYEKLRMGLIE